MRTSVIGFVFGIIAATLLTRAMAEGSFSRNAFVTKMEAAMDMRPGYVKTDPRFGFSIKYIGTKSLGDGVYAVYVQKLD